MTGPDTAHHDVGAYAIGALNEADAERFEAHLASCDDCADELASLLPLAAALEHVDLALLGPAHHPVRPPRRRIAPSRRIAPRQLAGVAAAVTLVLVTALAVVLALRPGSGPGHRGDALPAPSTAATDHPSPSAAGSPSPSAPPAAGIGGPGIPARDRFTTTDPVTGVHMDLALDGKQWGTQVYISVTHIAGPRECQLVAVARSGAVEAIATWRVPVDGYGTAAQPKPLPLMAATGLARGDIERIELRSMAGDGGTRRLAAVNV